MKQRHYFSLQSGSYVLKDNLGSTGTALSPLI